MKAVLAALAVSIPASALSGAGFAWILLRAERDTSSDSPPALVTAAPREADASLEPLLAELRGLRADLAMALQRPVGERAPAEVRAADVPERSSADWKELQVTLERLATSLERGAGSTTAPAPDLSVAIAAENGRRNLSSLPDVDERELGRMHFFQSYADILREYGKPDNIWHKDGMLRWHYTVGDEDVTIRFVDGFVVGWE